MVFLRGFFTGTIASGYHWPSLLVLVLCHDCGWVRGFPSWLLILPNSRLFPRKEMPINIYMSSVSSNMDVRSGEQQHGPTVGLTLSDRSYSVDEETRAEDPLHVGVTVALLRPPHHLSLSLSYS